LSCHALRRTVIAALLAASPAGAQATSASLRGRVIDHATTKPIVAARITLLSDRRSVTTDSAGRFLFLPLSAGVHRFVIEASPFPPTQLIVDVSANQDLVRTIELDSIDVQKLAPVSVSASEIIDHRFDAFRRRRSTGRGQYLTREEIERNGSSTLQDALRPMRGITMDCYGSGCYVRMARAPMRCLPDYVVDERVDNQFGPLTPIRDIEALEVYSGPSDVPGEFAGRTAGCGVIVIWTKSGPPPKR
jgi:hypothetical protein